ncbi:MAG: deoxyribose-phosphate aldolase [Bacteroidetes bacterium]|nr:deoxyribose-phosphate aldolase [Bacteroidota bacterium]MBU1114237.1 deoxyribose-phosphate aldolase [Bacteroidota bacterium]MBU1798006.1 deoxyribose-phosphate aldolase [Bacteroidota bacterium]
MDNLKFDDSIIKDFIKMNKESLIDLKKDYTSQEIASCIDHTILKPEAKPDDVINICNEAIENKFASVCVNSCYAPLVTSLLVGSDVKTCVVVGFPLGAMSTASKVAETEYAIKDGANEIDMVINIGMLKQGEYEYVLNDIRSVSNIAHAGNAICKVIIETSLLSNEEKVKACLISKTAKADFVKTSTGFNGGGATVEDISLMKRVVGNELKVKASGGVRTREDAVNMLNAGANRIGASAGVKIVANEISNDGGY